jgi:hypothetical protein
MAIFTTQELYKKLDHLCVGNQRLGRQPFFFLLAQTTSTWSTRNRFLRNALCLSWKSLERKALGACIGAQVEEQELTLARARPIMIRYGER